MSTLPRLTIPEWDEWLRRVDAGEHDVNAEVRVPIPGGFWVGTLLEVAVRTPDTSCWVQECLRRGARLSPSSPGTIPLLHAACRYGHVHTISLLLEAGADVNEWTSVRQTTLLHAMQTEVEAGNLSRSIHARVQRLIDAGVSFHTPTGGPVMVWMLSSPLFLWLSDESLADLLRLFLHAGADPHDANPETGATAGHVACSRGWLMCVQALDARGASWTVKNRQGRTPRDLIPTDPQGAAVRDWLDSERGCGLR